MARDTEPMQSGNEIVDTIKGVQVMANGIANPERKLDYVRRTLRMTRIMELRGQELMVGAARTFLRRPDDAPDELIGFNRSFLFAGRLCNAGYLLDQTIPVDTLTLHFDEVEVLDITERPEQSVVMNGTKMQFDMSDLPSFRRAVFEVPVLAIESCT